MILTVVRGSRSIERKKSSMFIHIEHNIPNMVAEHGCPHIVDVLVPPIMEEIAKVVKTVLQEQISERIRKQIV